MLCCVALYCAVLRSVVLCCIVYSTGTAERVGLGGL